MAVSAIMLTLAGTRDHISPIQKKFFPEGLPSIMTKKRNMVSYMLVEIGSDNHVKNQFEYKPMEKAVHLLSP